MAKLYTTEKLVLEVLEETPATRSDDYVLMYYVCLKVCPESISSLPFGAAMLFHKLHNIPNWETVTRCRRKIQEKRPDLVSPEAAKKRHKEEAEYREYAKT